MNRGTRLMTVVAAMLLVTSAGRAQTPEFAPQVVIPRAFPPIKDAPVVPADEAGRLLADEELVLGAVVDGKARAYPINMLTGPQREIVNDTLGGRAIAATW
jgi:hypothetical protein